MENLASTALRRVEIIGLHGGAYLRIELRPGLNILYGKNGSGKTTFLHVVANLLESDIARFCHLRFDRIRVEMYDGTTVDLQSVRTDTGDISAVRVAVDGEPLATVNEGDATPPAVRQTLRVCFGGRPVYLPAFRAVLEAISQDRIADRIQYEQTRLKNEFSRIVTNEEEDNARSFSSANRLLSSSYLSEQRAKGVAAKTVLCRDWFGSFVPVVRFPSLREVAEELISEVQHAQIRVSTKDREAFSDVFFRVLRTVLSRPNHSGHANVNIVLNSIRKSLSQLGQQTASEKGVYSQIASLIREHEEDPSIQESIAARILELYDGALQERLVAEQQAYEQLRTFQASVNRFLQDKKLDVDWQSTQRYSHRPANAKVILFPNGRRAGLSVLSSGERHVLTLLFSATHMSLMDGVLLIDEPELSLHVDWQRIILRELSKQAGDRQIIACTHAPEVTAEHRDAMIKLRSLPIQPELELVQNPTPAWLEE